MSSDSISSRRKAVFLLILTAVLWSSSGLCIKMIHWGPLGILGGRSIVAAVVFLVLGEIPDKLALMGGVLVLGVVIARAIVSSHTVPDEAT